MNLESLLKDLKINNIVFNSKLVQEGDLFVAISGFSTDGHDYIIEAVSAGARAIIGEKEFIETVPVGTIP
jgi:UDP-N-acetylmuramoyl-L-alanyl-D-glutamate--2,6-diaminopimelate ligase